VQGAIWHSEVVISLSMLLLLLGFVVLTIEYIVDFLVNRGNGWESHIIEFFALGTAVVAREGAATTPTPSLVVSLSDVQSE
jgi:hypothetical protein